MTGAIVCADAAVQCVLTNSCCIMLCFVLFLSVYSVLLIANAFTAADKSHLTFVGFYCHIVSLFLLGH